MHTPETFRATFAQALPYERYLETAEPHQLAGWKAFDARVTLTDAQKNLLRGIKRRVNILVISGTWCGDCVQQCPILAHFERAMPADVKSDDSPGIALRFIDRDEFATFATPFKICGGQRVPAAIFLNEDFEFISLFGDKTLSRFRALAARSLGPSCPLPGAPVASDEIAATTRDWLDEVERVSLLLRLSARLRQKHAD